MMQRNLGIFTALVLVLAALCLPAGRSEAAGLQDADFSCRGAMLGAKRSFSKRGGSRSLTGRRYARA